MKDKITREVIKEDGKVFLVSTKVSDKSKDNREIKETTTIKSQATLDVLDEYEKDREEQYNNFKKQEKDTKDKIKSLEKDYKKHSNERGYKAYKKNYDQYEIYENFIENNTDVSKFLTGDSLKDFEKYKKNRDKYKNFYICMQQEKQLDMLYGNLEAFNDIWEEDKMFINQIKEARRLLNG